MSESPIDTLVEALPGTLTELSAKTEFPVAQVLKFITHARREGHRITAVMGLRTPEGTDATVFRVAESAAPLGASRPASCVCATLDNPSVT